MEVWLVDSFEGDKLEFIASSFQKLKILAIESFSWLDTIVVEEGAILELWKMNLFPVHCIDSSCLTVLVPKDGFSIQVPGKPDMSCVVYKIGECMQELIRLWKEYESSPADEACEGSENGPTLEIWIPVERHCLISASFALIFR